VNIVAEGISRSAVFENTKKIEENARNSAASKPICLSNNSAPKRKVVMIQMFPIIITIRYAEEKEIPNAEYESMKRKGTKSG
jgi:hypothetical protein